MIDQDDYEKSLVKFCVGVALGIYLIDMFKIIDKETLKNMSEELECQFEQIYVEKILYGKKKHW